MLRLTRSFHSINRALQTNSSKIEPGIWSNFDKRSIDLKISNPILRDELIEGVDPKKGPITLKSSLSKMAYMSPVGLDEVFPLAYNLLQKESEKIYSKIDELKKKDTNDKKTKLEVKKLLIQAEKSNPEVLYKSQFSNPENLNLNEISFQNYYKTKIFDGFNKQLLLQRIEQLNVLPDALPTIDPVFEVSLKFIGDSGKNQYITPGNFLSSKITSYPPNINLKYLNIKEDLSENDLFSLIIINLDEPNLKTNSFNISLNYGIRNIKLNSNVSNINYGDYLLNKSDQLITDYLPPVPEKNSPNQRFVTILLKQESSLNDLEFDKYNFNLSEFLNNYKLNPVGINVWRSKWDSNVKNIRESYGLPKGKVYHRVRK